VAVRLNEKTTVGDVLVSHSWAHCTFERLGIECDRLDTRGLARAATDAGVELHVLVRALGDPIGSPNREDAPARQQPAGALTAIIEHIESRHHTFLRRELLRLEGLANAVIKPHASKPDRTLADVGEIYTSLLAEMWLHMAKEEQVLFPYVCQIESPSQNNAISPILYHEAVPDIIREIEQEHEAVLRAFERIRDVTSGYSTPEGASDDLRSLYGGLQALEEDLREHIHLEDSLGKHIEGLCESAAARERIEVDLHLARKIQEIILPDQSSTLQECEAVGFCVKILPAQLVGGDLYEFFFKDDRTLVVALGDVAGKGVAASLLMTMACTQLRTFAQEENSPSAIFRRMNRAFLEAAGGAPWFLTMFLAFYDTRNRSFRFANAGHWPPILAGSDGSTASLDPTAPVLGVLDQFASTDEEITLLPGERVVAYSDGITESRNVDGEEFGFAQLEALVAGGAERSPEDLLGHILTSAQAYRAGHLDHDDTTIWVLEAR